MLCMPDLTLPVDSDRFPDICVPRSDRIIKCYFYQDRVIHQKTNTRNWKLHWDFCINILKHLFYV